MGHKNRFNLIQKNFNNSLIKYAYFLFSTINGCPVFIFTVLMAGLLTGGKTGNRDITAFAGWLFPKVDDIKFDWKSNLFTRNPRHSRSSCGIWIKETKTAIGGIITFVDMIFSLKKRLCVILTCCEVLRWLPNLVV